MRADWPPATRQRAQVEQKEEKRLWCQDAAGNGAAPRIACPLCCRADANATGMRHTGGLVSPAIILRQQRRWE